MHGATRAGWWERDGDAFANLVAGLQALNISRDDGGSAEFRRLFAGLLGFARPDPRAEHGPCGDAPAVLAAFIEMVSDGLVDAGFFDAPAFRRLTQAPQRIVSEAGLRRQQERAGRLELERAELELARAEHVELVDATIAFDLARTPRAARRLSAALAALVCVVAANLDAADRTAFGSPAEKVRRDATAVATATPVLEALVLGALGNPEQRLAVYGTLRRGRSNHQYIADLGEPRSGVVRGGVGEKDGYPVFRWDESGDEIPVELYASTMLTARRWKPLDLFEGDGYARVLVPVRDDVTALRTVAMIYADAAPAGSPLSSAGTEETSR